MVSSPSTSFWVNDKSRLKQKTQYLKVDIHFVVRIIFLQVASTSPRRDRIAITLYSASEITSHATTRLFCLDFHSLETFLQLIQETPSPQMKFRCLPKLYPASANFPSGVGPGCPCLDPGSSSGSRQDPLSPHRLWQQVPRVQTCSLGRTVFPSPQDRTGVGSLWSAKGWSYMYGCTGVGPPCKITHRLVPDGLGRLVGWTQVGPL